ncbi:hypothetical protein DRO49_01400 [Candidatus Bathyarchaeota archaeon]|nr:MAG: hypothetical protein DRO49_01400 [Candidatus Bathyarchaeota archaeon]
MQRTIRINEESYRIVKELAEERHTSMCKAASSIISRFAEEMKSGVDVGDYTITVRDLSAEVKVVLRILISEIDEIIRSSMSAEEKIEKLKALLYTWMVGNKIPPWWCESEGEESGEDMVWRNLGGNQGRCTCSSAKGGEKKKEVKDNERERL